MNKNKLGRVAITALLMALCTTSCKYNSKENNKPEIIDTIPIEDLESYKESFDNFIKEETVSNKKKSSVNDNYDYSSLEDFYFKEMSVPKNVIGFESTKALNDEIYNYLGNDIYCNGTTLEEGSTKAVFFNKDGKYVSVTRFSNDTFFANYGEDNWFIDVYTYGDKQFSKQYYADDNNNFIRLDFENNILVDESIFYGYEDNITMAISLYDKGDEKVMYIMNNDDVTLTIKLSEEDYSDLSVAMATYSDGKNLNKFLLESCFSKYLDIIAINDLDLYYELINYDNTKTLKLTTM